MRISVIFPVVGSDLNFYLEESFAELAGDARIEAICVDATATAGVRQLCDAHGIRYLPSGSQRRADRLSEGIGQATGDWIVLHHPRSLLRKANLLQLAALDASAPRWGAWTHSFDQSGLFYDFTSWYSNRIRGDRCGVFYLDHCLYLNRTMLERVGSGFIPSVEIFEDTLLSQALRAISQPQRLPGRATTSGVRFQTNGRARQAALNQLLKICFYLRIPYRVLNRKYEGNLKLNGRTER